MICKAATRYWKSSPKSVLYHNFTYTYPGLSDRAGLFEHFCQPSERLAYSRA